MYHPTRGGVRGGRDQFKWDDVKVDKHRENYLGHSIKAPVGRWQKGKDLYWYARDKKSQGADQDALKTEIQKVKEEEEQLMREALGLAPKRANRPQGNRLDKHEFSELVKRGSTAEDLGEGHAEAAEVHGLGFSRASRPWEASSSSEPSMKEISTVPMDKVAPEPPVSKTKEEDSEDERSQKKRRREDKKRDKEERRRDKEERRDKLRSHDSEERRKHRKDKHKRRHDSESD